MEKAIYFLKKNIKEISYQTILIIILFVFFSYKEQIYKVKPDQVLLVPYEIAFFSNYIFSSIIIIYWLFPKYYYKKKYLLFSLFTALLIGIVILIDEFILEQLYFPNTRGTYFPGILFSLLETLPIMIIMVTFKIMWDFQKKQNEIEELKLHVKESELQFLKSQINPHFLFNNLNNLYSYSLDNSPKTSSIILELSSVLRYMLYDCREDYVPLTKELHHLKNFTQLNELQIEDRGVIEYEENITSYNFKIAPLILVVFIENAFKHSTMNQSDNIFIRIEIDVNEEGTLNFSCENNYKNNTKGASNLESGIGLENVKKRLNLIYHNKYNLIFETNENTFKANLSIKLNPSDKC